MKHPIKFHLVTGGCGFIGRNMVKFLLKNKPKDNILIVDDLSEGRHPEDWLGLPLNFSKERYACYGQDQKVHFFQEDLGVFIRRSLINSNHLFENFQLPCSSFENIYHFAAKVGGIRKIDNDPLAIAQNISLDADLFYWISRRPPVRLLYPSSSAAYPIVLQDVDHQIPLKEENIGSKALQMPDRIYGWSKISGEFLASQAAKKYGISIACVRPFSGYGPDQSLDYPIPAIVNRFVRRQDPLVVWGDGTQKRDFIYIEDLIEGMELALQNVHDGSAINLGSGQGTSFLEVINLLSEITGFQPAIEKKMNQPVGVHNRFCDPTLARKRLGWKPKISLKSGLVNVYKFISENRTS